jgi:hypothetical protein
MEQARCFAGGSKKPPPLHNDNYVSLTALTLICFFSLLLRGVFVALDSSRSPAPPSVSPPSPSLEAAGMATAGVGAGMR